MRSGKCYFISENVSFSVKFSRRMVGTGGCSMWTFVTCSLCACPCASVCPSPATSGHPTAAGLWVTLLPSCCDPFQTGSTVWKLTSSRSCSCRTSQYRWLLQKMKMYFLASKVWNWGGKISAICSSFRGTNIYPKGAGSHRNYHLLCVVSSHPCGKESAVQKALEE